MDSDRKGVMNRYVRNVIVWGIILAVVAYFFLPLARTSSLWPDLLSTFLPFLLLIGLWTLMLRQAKGKQWLVAENGTLVNTTHIVSLEASEASPPGRGYSVVATMVTGASVVIASNLEAEEARRRLAQLKSSL